ncbi:pentapeptide repeat-containing protein [Nonomuraea sp. NPDC049158]|uniref:pentapeptide repeat-containing protein n=1 Tax=Nonomuraea sp. NPDC049158 TaxID=3155649 RepID=UPI0034110D15
MLPAALLIGGAAWGTVEWLLQDLNKLLIIEQISARIEAARTALAAAAGVGAAVTLMLAVRRQRHQELATAHTTHDAAERRVTELYTKAAEQLGNSQAPVRLAGLYALERLAQDTPALRQTIVDVICSYLRMPYTPPREDRSEKIRAAQRTARNSGSARSGTSSSGRNPHEERQVRLTAQRILTAHLQYDDSPTPRRRWPARRLDTNPRHWPNSRLYLVGAVLIDFDLRACHMGNADFSHATFTGDARFGKATFTGYARFGEVTFTGDARFGEVTFTGPARFDDTTFTGDAEFGGAIFTSDAQFDDATFTRNAEFGGAIFTSDAEFNDTTFTHNAGFAGVTFSGGAGFIGATFTGALFIEATFSSDAQFGVATFTGPAQFCDATFTRNVWFSRATFTGAVWFDGVTFTGPARFEEATFSSDAQFGKATFTRHAGFAGATGLEAAELSGVRLAPAGTGVRRVWPPAWQVVAGADGWQTLRLAAEPDELGK